MLVCFAYLQLVNNINCDSFVVKVNLKWLGNHSNKCKDTQLLALLSLLLYIEKARTIKRHCQTWQNSPFWLLFNQIGYKNFTLATLLILGLFLEFIQTQFNCFFLTRFKLISRQLITNFKPFWFRTSFLLVLSHL